MQNRNVASKALLFFLMNALPFVAIHAQGCVAIRHFSSCVGNSLENNVIG